MWGPIRCFEKFDNHRTITEPKFSVVLTGYNVYKLWGNFYYSESILPLDLPVYSY